jgi:hypothetical protein
MEQLTARSVKFSPSGHGLAHVERKPTRRPKAKNRRGLPLSGRFVPMPSAFTGRGALRAALSLSVDSVTVDRKAAILRRQAEELRSEFNTLSEQWRRDTQHLSLISKKVAHPGYLRIIGMGEAAVPLLLEALRNKPAHWFAALKAITNFDPVPTGSNPSAARELWINWGMEQGLID